MGPGLLTYRAYPSISLISFGLVVSQKTLSTGAAKLITLLGTNISPFKGTFGDDFPNFPFGGSHVFSFPGGYKLTVDGCVFFEAIPTRQKISSLPYTCSRLGKQEAGS